MQASSSSFSDPAAIVSLEQFTEQQVKWELLGPEPKCKETGESSIDIHVIVMIKSFCYLGDVISCGGGVESAVKERISCAWSKWRELACLLVKHSIPPVKRKE